MGVDRETWLEQVLGVCRLGAEAHRERDLLSIVIFWLFAAAMTAAVVGLFAEAYLAFT